MTNIEKLNTYSYFYILSTCESSNPEMREFDGMELKYLSEAIQFAKQHKAEIMSEPKKFSIMIWNEFIEENGSHQYNNCVGSISLADMLTEISMNKEKLDNHQLI